MDPYPTKLELLDMLGDEQMRVLALRRQINAQARDLCRWRHACLAACRRLADAEDLYVDEGFPVAELGCFDYAPAKCTTHHGTRPAK